MGEVVDITNRLREGDARLLARFLLDAGFTADDMPSDEYSWRIAATAIGITVAPDADTKALTALFMAGAELAGAR